MGGGEEGREGGGEGVRRGCHLSSLRSELFKRFHFLSWP